MKLLCAKSEVERVKIELRTLQKKYLPKILGIASLTVAYMADANQELPQHEIYFKLILDDKTETEIFRNK